MATLASSPPLSKMRLLVLAAAASTSKESKLFICGITEDRVVLGTLPFSFKVFSLSFTNDTHSYHRRQPLAQTRSPQYLRMVLVHHPTLTSRSWTQVIAISDSPILGVATHSRLITTSIEPPTPLGIFLSPLNAIGLFLASVFPQVVHYPSELTRFPRNLHAQVKSEPNTLGRKGGRAQSV